MPIIKVSEATPLQLNYLAAKLEGGANFVFDGITWGFTLNDQSKVLAAGWAPSMSFVPATNWDTGGPIIERECIDLTNLCPGTWRATNTEHWFNGPTPLIAAMRCFVASKLGNEVEIPEELA